MRMLLACGDVEPDSKDHLGGTPLSQAAQRGHEAVVRLLLALDDVELNSKEPLKGTATKRQGEGTRR